METHMNIIFGAGGFAKEVGWLLSDVARTGGLSDKVDAFVASDDAPNLGTAIHGANVIPESEFFMNYGLDKLKVYIAVGSPQLRKRLHRKCTESLEFVEFPALVHPSVRMDTRAGAVQFDAGAIVCAGTILTTDVQVGAFVHLNLNCTVGHDAQIGDFSTLSPGVHVSGGVLLGRSCFVGTGAVLLENVQIPDETIIGAGATVLRTLVAPGTYVGTPARLRQ
jgi:sugar O-acyltransferase (sialic acid O-acetyltransferase NeuD family)